MLRITTFAAIIAALATGITSCGKVADDTRDPAAEKAAARDGRTQETEAAPENLAGAAGSQSVFRLETFRADEAARLFKVEGKITGGAKWIDSNGENTLIVSEKTENKGDFTVQRIFGYLFAGEGGRQNPVWKIQDWAENPCDAGKGLTSPVEVSDIDGDGIAENMFVYNVAGPCDVSPVPYKLMMHSGEKKLAVRGESAVDVPGLKNKGKKNFDPAFDSSPREFRETASRFWDRYVRPVK